MKRVLTFSLLLLCSSLGMAVHPERVRVKEAFMQSRLIRRVDPVHPADAARIGGKVVLQAVINKSGEVENLKLISGHPLLVSAAIDAAKQWKYRPYLLNGSPVSVETTITVDFRHSKTPAVGTVGSVPGGIVPGRQGGIVPSSTGAATAQHPLIPVPMYVRVSKTVEAARLLKKVPLKYPPEAKAQHIEGAVLLRAFIDKQGNVAHLELISGHPVLAPAAIESVQQWKYQPYLLNNEAVEVVTQIEVNFKLPGNSVAKGTAGDKLGGIPPGELGGIAPSSNSSHPQSSRVSVPRRVRISSTVAKGLLVKSVDPTCPGSARVQGAVVLKVVIDKEGNVTEIKLISGHPLLAPRAIDAVRQWKYRPFLLNDAPVEVETQVVVGFKC